MSEHEDTYDDDALAAEYVLHLLDAAERRAFEDRLNAEPALRAQVHSWEARFAPLAEALPETTPPARLRRRLLHSLAAEHPRRRWALPVWGWLSGGIATAAVLLFVMFAVFRQPAPDQRVAFEAELASADRSLVMVAGVIPATHEIVIDRLAGAPPQGRVHELWLIAEGATAPVSLGLLANAGPTRIQVPDAIAPGVRSGTIAVSVEPPGGSPTGSPTGAVVATAQFNDV